jgi:hypothetical protein
VVTGRAVAAPAIAPLVGALAFLAGCKPNLDDVVSQVTAPEVVAIRADPAEVVPGNAVRYTALYVGPSGPITSGAIDWSFCDERKPLAELEPVSPLCYQATGSWFVDLGVGTSVTGVVSDDACSLFGPDVPQPQPNQPPGRPVDPDPTGGYYQPVRVLTNGHGNGSDAVDIGETRIACGLAGSSSDLVAQFAQRYHVNANPSISTFGPTSPKAAWTDDTAPGNAGAMNDWPNAVGRHFNLEVAWPPCPTTDVCGDGVCGPDETPLSCASCPDSVAVCPGDCSPVAQCQGAERYVVFDQATNALVDQREGMSVLWYATGGAFDVDRTGREGSDLSTVSDNGWTAPDQPGVVTLWVVLLDDRGGTSWGEYVIDVH